jgi:hypothetical protein
MATSLPLPKTWVGVDVLVHELQLSRSGWSSDSRLEGAERTARTTPSPPKKTPMKASGQASIRGKRIVVCGEHQHAHVDSVFGGPHQRPASLDLSQSKVSLADASIGDHLCSHLVSHRGWVRSPPLIGQITAYHQR